MRSFFKIFLATLAALLVFVLLLFYFIATYIGGVAKKDVPRIYASSVLVLDLSQHFTEQAQQNPLSYIRGGDLDVPGLYDVLRLLKQSKTDDHISGIYVIANSNANGFAASDEIRNALADFKKSGKFVLAYGDIISQRAYSIANIADRVFVSPQGYFEWSGYSVEYAFLKGTIDKLNIEPQIFYAGKFKSATEPLRMDHMSPENQLQTSVWLNELYDDLLQNTATARKVDTATLRRLANEGSIRYPKDAVAAGLVDAVKYDDQFKDELKTRLKLGKYDRIEFVSINTYLAARPVFGGSGDRIALIYAEGDIVDGKGDKNSIGGDNYRNLIRKARLDKSIRAIVFRVNSGGGSTLASEAIWRELSLAKLEKPVVVSFGDVAASGGYYVSCAADSIFASRVTITGSIGVFGIVPNMQSFFRDKIGVTFDGVKTGPYADAGAIYRPLDENEKRMIQANIENIYQQFKQRVADGRKKDTAFVETIAQGRVWTGTKAMEIGLIDRFGGIDDAVQCAARMAKLKEYRVSGYPERRSFLDQLFDRNGATDFSSMMRAEVGDENYRIYEELKRVKVMTGTAQARLPFQMFVH